METIIAMIIIGIWGTIVLIGMTLIKLERTKAECWVFLNNYCECDCESEEESEENE